MTTITGMVELSPYGQEMLEHMRVKHLEAEARNESVLSITGPTDVVQRAFEWMCTGGAVVVDATLIADTMEALDRAGRHNLVERWLAVTGPIQS